MKKILLLIGSLMVVFALCSCSPEPVEYTVDEMKFTVTDDLTLEEDEQAAKEALVDSGSYESMELANELAHDLVYLDGENYTLSVTSTHASYSEAELEECIDAVYENDTTKESNDLTVDGTPAKIGYYTIKNCETHFIYVVKNGIFYAIELALYEGNEYPEGYLESIAETIVFDNSLLETQTGSIGNLEVTFPENYAPLESDGLSEGFAEQIFYGKYGKTEADEVQYSISRSEGTDFYGQGIDRVLDILFESYSDVEEFSLEGPLGTYACRKGIDTDGSFYMLTIIEHDGDLYWMDVISMEEADSDLLQTFIDSVEAKADEEAEE